MKPIKNRNESMLRNFIEQKKLNNKFLPKGLNANIFVLNVITTLISSTLSIAAGWDSEITFKLAAFSFISTQLVIFFVMNFSHIKNSFSIFSYLLVFCMQILLFMIAKTSYNIDYEILNNGMKLTQLNQQIKELESLSLHKARLEKQLATYLELNKQKQEFQNLTCPDAVSIVEHHFSENTK